LWMESLSSTLQLQYGVSEASANFESSTTYFSNQRAIKYEPSSGIHLIESDFQQKGAITINDYALDETDLEILKNLIQGNGIKTNYSLLCKKTHLHRKTVDKRITTFLTEGVLSRPLCRFPNYFVPPNYILTYSLFEIKKSHEKLIREIVRDPHVSIAYKILYGKFNFLLFGNHSNIGDHLKWEEGYREKFPDAIGSVNITYLSPQMTIAFHRQIVPLSLIQSKLQSLRGKQLRQTMKTER
jgi:predicted transcriptional regulator